jgi:diaminohydroxyphosphoribosylaminopyrimidine deaminase/5-amino-6-(5-phosphoribosylamino)uracil reductase
MSNTFSAFDNQMMAIAIALAKQGQYTTAPNPNVGCVIVRGNQVIGQGFHYKAGEPHAEVHALRQAGSLAEGATAYVTLEPCSHYGRTPPCAKGLIDAKVTKVICAMQDPNPQVSGRGIAMLRDAGIDVQVGLMESQAIYLNRGFIKRMKSGLPFVQLKMASSLDGKTALENGKSQWITGKGARQDVQTFRAKASAILSTAQTVIEDNASLNVRADDLPSCVLAGIDASAIRQPIRVILDAQDRLSEDLNLFQSPGERLILGSTIAKQHDLFDPQQRFDLTKLLRYLAEHHSINDLWVEAGATLAGEFVQQCLVDELIVYLAPKLMGQDGRSLLGLTGISDMADTIDLDIADVRMIGQDIRVCCSLKQKN